jgi:hypothetical protein
MYVISSKNLRVLKLLSILRVFSSKIYWMRVKIRLISSLNLTMRLLRKIMISISFLDH